MECSLKKMDVPTVAHSEWEMGSGSWSQGGESLLLLLGRWGEGAWILGG